MKVIVAIDSFKGCLSSIEANQAATEGILAACSTAEVIQVPVSDGGEGWLESYQAAIGGELVTLTVHDPLMRLISSCYLIKENVAVIEMAKASGLTLVTEEERNPIYATSYGTGELISDAIGKGCREIIVGLGGSATSDCGKGMLRAIIDTYAKGGTWDDVKGKIKSIRFLIAADVKNPLYGKKGAAYVFAPQKGATPEMVELLDLQARRFAEFSSRHYGYDYSQHEGAGAAGGLGYALMQYLGGECHSGIELLLDSVDFNRLMTDTTLIITGEGSTDSQTLMGKVPYGILQRGVHAKVSTALIAGRISDQQTLTNAGFSFVRCINPPNLPQNEAIKKNVAYANIRQTVSDIIRTRPQGK